MNRSRRMLLVAVSVLAVASDQSQGADAYPTHPVTIVVPYPAGGVVDVRVREIAVGLEKEPG